MATSIDDYSHVLDLVLNTQGYERLQPPMNHGRLRVAGFNVLLDGVTATISSGTNYALCEIPVNAGLLGLVVSQPAASAATAQLKFGRAAVDGGGTIAVQGWVKSSVDNVYRVETSAGVPAYTDDDDAYGLINLASPAQLIKIVDVGSIIYRERFYITMTTAVADITTLHNIAGAALYVVD